MSHQSVNDLLKKKLYLYKMKLVHEVREKDYDRTEFCEITIKRCNEDKDFAANIFLPDEAKCSRYWSKTKQHLTIAILNDRRSINDSLFTDKNFNAQTYLFLLRNQVIW